MRILHLITSLKIGGAESFLVYLLEKFKNDENEHVVVYFYDGPNVEILKKLGFSVFKISGKFKLYDPWFYFSLKNLIKKIKPDLIHTSLWSANIVGRIIAKKLNIPIVCDLHNDSKFNGKIRNFLEKRTIQIPKKFVAVSNFVGESFKKSFLSASKDKITVIQNGIDFETLQKKAFENQLKRTDFGFSENDFIIGAIGRLEPIKSFDVLIKIFSELKEDRMKLCIVGDGSQKNDLIKLSKELGLENKVFFAGQRDDAYKFYPLFNCFALTSKTEGLSIALLEALSFGLPILTTHQNLTHEVIVDGVNGFLIPRENNDLFVLKLKQIYSDQLLLNEIRNNNLKLIRTKFDISKVVLKYKELYKEVV